MARFTVRVFRSFGFLRVVAVVMSDCLGSACFRMVMIVAEQVLDAAIRRRQQPKHDTACRHNAEADVDFWLPRNHTLNSLFIIPCRGGAGGLIPPCAAPAGKARIIFSPFLSSPCLWSRHCPVWSRSRRRSRHRTCPATVLEFGDVAFGVAGDGQWWNCNPCTHGCRSVRWFGRSPSEAAHPSLLASRA